MIEALFDMLGAWLQDTFFGNGLKRLLFGICMWLVAVGTLLGMAMMAWESCVWIYAKLRKLFCRKKVE